MQLEGVGMAVGGFLRVLRGGVQRAGAQELLRRDRAACRGAPRFGLVFLFACLGSAAYSSPGGGATFCGGDDGAMLRADEANPSSAVSQKTKKKDDKMLTQEIMDDLAGPNHTPEVVKKTEDFLKAQGIIEVEAIKHLCPEDVDSIPSSELSLGCKILLRTLFSKLGNTNATKLSKRTSEAPVIDMENMSFDQGMELLESGEVHLDASGEEIPPFSLTAAPNMLPPKAAICVARKALQKGQRLKQGCFPALPISHIFNPDWGTLPERYKGSVIWGNFATYLGAWNMAGYVWQCSWADGVGPLVNSSIFNLLTNTLLRVCSVDGPSVAILYIDHIRSKINHNISHNINFDMEQYIVNIDSGLIKSIKDKLYEGSITAPIKKYSPQPYNYGKQSSFPKGKGKGTYSKGNYSKGGGWDEDLDVMARAIGACSFFTQYGSCSYGNNCNFKHMGPQQVRSMQSVHPTGGSGGGSNDKKKKKDKHRSRSRSRDRRSRDRRGNR